MKRLDVSLKPLKKHRFHDFFTFGLLRHFSIMVETTMTTTVKIIQYKPITAIIAI